jgi:hypothetical protein
MSALRAMPARMARVTASEFITGRVPCGGEEGGGAKGGG